MKPKNIIKVPLPYLWETRSRMSIKSSIEESVLRLKNLLKGENPAMKTVTLSEADENTARKGAIDPGAIPDRARASAMQYAGKLGGTDKMRADNIIKSTLLKGYSGAVDATFITDLDTRWVNNQRVSLETPKTISYDYIIQMLAYLYNTPDGQSVEVGGQQFPVTPGMKKNIYEGLLKMFDLQDSKGRWRWFIFGSNIPGVSTVPSVYRPKISTKPDGRYDFDEADQYIAYLNFWLKGGQLLNIMNKGGFYDKGFAYVLTTVRMKYNELKRQENAKKRTPAGYDAYLDPSKGVDLSDPRMVGANKDLGGKIDTTMDLRYLGTRDNGENPGHNSITRFVDALKVTIDGASDLDEKGESVGMAEHVAEGLLKFVTERFAAKPWYIDCFKAKAAGIKSLDNITRPEYAELYPHANKFYQGKSRTAAITSFKAACESVINPEAERLAAEYMQTMDSVDADAPEIKAKDKWNDFADSKDNKVKLKYDDYVTDDPNDVWNSLEETEGDNNANLMAAVVAAVDRFLFSN